MSSKRRCAFKRCSALETAPRAQNGAARSTVLRAQNGAARSKRRALLLATKGGHRRNGGLMDLVIGWWEPS
jgi:hypothetical protein